jgi:hypothetical protein
MKMSMVMMTMEEEMQMPVQIFELVMIQRLLVTFEHLPVKRLLLPANNQLHALRHDEKEKLSEHNGNDERSLTQFKYLMTHPALNRD